MHKQFQKIGLFISRNPPNKNNDKVDDKIVKYLYRNEHKNKEKSHGKKSQLRNVHEEEDHRRKHRKKPIVSSATQVYVLSPDESKKCKKSHKLKALEEIPKQHDPKGKNRSELERKIAKIKHDELAKLIKKHKLIEKIKSNQSNDNQWLAKSDFIKLLSNHKNLQKEFSVSAALLKKFFVFNDKESTQDGKTEKHSKKLGRSKDDSANIISIPNKPSGDKHMKHSHKDLERRLEKSSREYEQFTDHTISKRSNKNFDKVGASIPSKKTHAEKSSVKRSEGLNGEHVKPLRKNKSPVRTSTNTKTPEKKNTEHPPEPGAALKSDFLRMDPESLKYMQEEILKLVKTVQKIRRKESEQTVTKESVQTVTKTPPVEIRSKQNSQKDVSKKPKETTDQMNNVNPVRHKNCLVNNTFPVVTICPTLPPPNPVEKKKKMKIFKKYYRYDNPEDEVEIRTETYQTHSDCHKMYQDTSEQSVVRRKRQSSKEKERSYEILQRLKAETHVNTIIIENLQVPNKNNELKKRRSRNSRIPVLSNPVKMVKSITKALISPTHKKEEVKDTGDKVDNDVPGDDKDSKMNTLHSNAAQEKTVNVTKEKRNNANVPRRNSSPEKGKSIDVKTVKEKAPSSASKHQKNFSADHRNTQTKTKSTVYKHVADDVIFEQEESNSNSSSASKHSKSRKQTESTKATVRSSKVSGSASPRARKSVTNSERDESKRSSGSSLNKKKKAKKTALESKSETNLRQTKKVVGKKLKTIQKCTAKPSFSNSTVGVKSTDSSTKTTSYFLTKNYRDDDKLTRWQKSKRYADEVRRNLINKGQKAPSIPPQVVEVRYFTVDNGNSTLVDQKPVGFPSDKSAELEESDITSTIPEDVEKRTPSPETTRMGDELNVNCFANDLPPPCIELIEQEKFNELFQLPADEALNEILNENYNFLQKDFSYNFEYTAESSSISSADLSVNDFPRSEKKMDEWFDFTFIDEQTLSDISFYNNKHADFDVDGDVNGEYRERIIASSSAPDSEESGYYTLRSRSFSPGFFQRPNIKSLFYPYAATPLDSYFVEVQVERQSSGVEIRSIESKSLQTVIECAQKSVQIKLSQEEFLERMNLNNNKDCLMLEEEPILCDTVSIPSDDSQEEKLEKKFDNVSEDKDENEPGEVAENVCIITQEVKDFCDEQRVKYLKNKKQHKGVKSKIFLSCFPCVTEK